MRRLCLLVFGVLIGGGLVYSAFHFHVVRASDEWLVVRKGKVELADFYVDIRQWSFQDWRSRSNLMHALMERGRGDLLVPPGSRNFFHGLQRKVGSALDELDTLRE